MAKSELVFGTRAVQALIERDPAGVLEVWMQERRDPSALRRALAAPAASDIAVHRVRRVTIERMVGDVAHQGVVARYRPSATEPMLSLDGLLARTPLPSLIVVLEQVQDPRNLGACMRCAAGAGADAVVVGKRRSASLTPAARKAACGAAERLPVVEAANLARALDRIAGAGISVVGTAAGSERSLYDADLRGPLAFVFGGEERGLRRLTREKCRLIVSIPMHEAMESLNVAAAAAVCLFEAVRQRRPGAPPVEDPV